MVKPPAGSSLERIHHGRLFHCCCYSLGSSSLFPRRLRVSCLQCPAIHLFPDFHLFHYRLFGRNSYHGLPSRPHSTRTLVHQIICKQGWVEKTNEKVQMLPVGKGGKMRSVMVGIVMTKRSGNNVRFYKNKFRKGTTMRPDWLICWFLFITHSILRWRWW